MLLNFPVVPSYYSRLPQTLGFTTHRYRQKYYQRGLAIAYIGYGTIDLGWGVSHGSYTNATRRFVKAVCGVYGNQIRWPTDPGTATSISNGFENPVNMRGRCSGWKECGDRGSITPFLCRAVERQKE